MAAGPVLALPNGKVGVASEMWAVGGGRHSPTIRRTRTGPTGGLGASSNGSRRHDDGTGGLKRKHLSSGQAIEGVLDCAAGARLESDEADTEALRDREGEPNMRKLALATIFTAAAVTLASLSVFHPVSPPTNGLSASAVLFGQALHAGRRDLPIAEGGNAH
jgi:hypothetical protein